MRAEAPRSAEAGSLTRRGATFGAALARRGSRLRDSRPRRDQWRGGSEAVDRLPGSGRPSERLSKFASAQCEMQPGHSGDSRSSQGAGAVDEDRMHEDSSIFQAEAQVQARMADFLEQQRTTARCATGLSEAPGAVAAATGQTDGTKTTVTTNRRVK